MRYCLDLSYISGIFSVMNSIIDMNLVIYNLISAFKSTYLTPELLNCTLFRALGALGTSLCASLIIGHWFIGQSKRFFRSKAREWAPQHHKSKDDTPTMGGIFILLATGLTVFMWAHLTEPRILIILALLMGFGVIGALDDWYKITKKRGISARTKSILQVAISGSLMGYWIWGLNAPTQLILPFYNTIQLDIGGFLFLLWSTFIIVGTSNAVNLTDGLDGLATGSLIPNFGLFSLIAYLLGNSLITDSSYLCFTETSEIAVMGCALMGSCIGFLWYNAYPARIFMGDVGSLSLGAGLACIALMLKLELLLALSAGIFVLETVSVIIQVFSVRWRGKRIFRMAPIHHHFELIGWPETRIVVWFSILSFILCIVAYALFKLS